jgi:hypothetical protein
MVHFNHRQSLWPSCLAALLLILSLTSCGDKAPTITENPNGARLSGTWVLKTKFTETGGDAPSIDRQMKIVLSKGQLFEAEFRGNDSEKWIRGGQGSFSYDPPLLTLYWESGQTNALLVVEKDQNTMVLHHCRTMIPVKDQEPSEVFVRQKGGPTRGAS